MHFTPLFILLLIYISSQDKIKQIGLDCLIVVFHVTRFIQWIMASLHKKGLIVYSFFFTIAKTREHQNAIRIIKMFQSYKAVKTFPGCGGKKKLERNLWRLIWNVEKKHHPRHLKSFRLIWISLDWWFQPGPDSTHSSRAPWLKAKERTKVSCPEVSDIAHCWWYCLQRWSWHQVGQSVFQLQPWRRGLVVWTRTG